MDAIASDLPGRPIAVTPSKDGIDLTIGFSLDGEPMAMKIGFTRLESREFARLILWASGDAMERTFPKPPIPEG